MKINLLILVQLLYIGFSNLCHSQGLENCKAYLHNDTLTLENDRIYQHFQWNNGNLIRLDFGLQSSKRSIIVPDNKTVIENRKEMTTSKNGQLLISEQIATSTTAPYLKVAVTYSIGKLNIQRVFRIFPKCPAIACELYFKGAIENVKDVKSEPTKLQEGLLSGSFERVPIRGAHWKARSVEFFDVTDRNNTLIQTYDRLAYTQECQLRGNLLLLENWLTGQRIFLLKEAPTSSVQLYYPGYDFTLKRDEVKVMGSGVARADLNDSIWVRGYGTVIGLSESNDELGILTSLKEYQRTIRVHQPDRDEMIMMNTWGDRSQDSHIGEKFAIAELEAGAKLGITHFQLDDGWQYGRSPASAQKGGSFSNMWKDDNYWKVNPERFPNGLEPVVKRGKELGIEIGLWFNPCRDNNYEYWYKDAGVLIGFYKQYGIRTFKIDGVNLPDKLAEVNFRKFLDKVKQETNNKVVVNFDVTAQKRGGYHYLNENGNLFLENRYTDFQNYFPYTTLRNLWMLSKYVPAQNLQIEFLNKWRNTDKYAGDPFAPINYSFDYLFAVTMAGQPLAWLEGSRLPDNAFQEVGPVIKKYREIQFDFHKGNIFPIGEEPSGMSWTGFQSIQEGGGYFLVFRENNNNVEVKIKTWLPAGKNIKCTNVIGKGKDFSEKIGENGTVTFNLPEKNSYALYHYSIENSNRKFVNIDGIIIGQD